MFCFHGGDFDSKPSDYALTQDWNLGEFTSKELWLRELARLMISGKWIYHGDPEQPVSQTKAVSPRRRRSKKEKPLSAFLADNLTLTALSATPDDW